MNRSERCEYYKKYYEANKDKLKEYYRKYREKNKNKIRKYREKNKDKIKERSRKYREDSKDKIRETVRKYREKNKDKLREFHRKYYEDNKDKVRENHKKYREKRYKDPGQKLKLLNRSRIQQELKKNNIKKISKSPELLGCTVQEAREHLEKQFKEGMTWENHGLYGWHIDHIIPCASFDLTDLEQQKKCFHYTNLQPLWAKENLIKGVKIL